MIVKVQMINCQSWRNETFDLATDRLNVIAADNGVGKSVFFKMLKISSDPNYFDRAERKDLIRRHAEYARIIFEFDDGGLAATTVYPTYTLYTYKAADSTTAETAYEPFPKMLQQLGLLTDGATSFVANMVDADQDLLLVNSRTKYNYNLAKMLAEHADLERIRDYLQKVTVDVANPLSSLINRCTTLENTIDNSSYCDIGMQELELRKLEFRKDLLMSSIDIYNDLLLIETASNNHLDFGDLLNALDLEENITSMRIDDILTDSVPPNVEMELNLLECLQDLQLSELEVIRKPAEIDQALNMLETLEQLDLNDVQIINKPADVEKSLDLLDLASNLQLDDLQELSDPAYLHRSIDILEYVQDILSAYESLCEAQMKIQTSENMVKRLHTELMHSGEILECAVYGKVVYNGQECIPCGD